jgi:predicted transcriptional regulator of viral defense system
MNWPNLLTLLRGSTLFEASMLLAGPDSPAEIRRQLSRWVASGRLLQLRRGLYALAPPFAASPPDPLAVAARLRWPSYVSLESALSYHGVIPEAVPAATSVTTGRPGRLETPLGVFLYRHVKRSLFWGYREIDVGGRQSAYVADPEKALLDLFYLTPGVIRPAFLSELRLAPEQVDPDRLRQHAERASSRKLARAASLAARLLAERSGEEVLS